MRILERKFNLKLIAGLAPEGDAPIIEEDEEVGDAFSDWLDEVIDTTGEVEDDFEPEVEEGSEEAPSEEAPEQEGQEETPEETPAPEQPQGQESEPEPVKTAPVEEVKPSKTPEQEQADLETFMGELQKQYAISDEDADAILTDPKAVLPKLMANAHAMILQQVGAFIQQAMPQMVQSQVRNVSTTDQRLGEFKTMYPELVKPENQAIAMAAVQTVKAANPGISYQDMLKKVGPVAEALLGKPLAAKAPAKPTAAKPAPHIPARPVSSTQVPRQKSSDPTVAFFESLSKF